LSHTREEILGRFRHAPLEAFRASYSYNNFGLTAAGDAAAKAAGTTFAELMQQQLFGLAGMTASSVDNVEFLTRENRAAIHIPIDGGWQVGPTRQPDAQAPAGGVSSSLHDISTWVRLVLGAGTLDGTPIIDRAALTTTHLPHVVRAPLSGYDAQTRSYGLGWNLENDHLGFLRWSHSGAFTAGAATTIVLLPTEQLGVVVLTNGKPLGVPEIIADEIIDQAATGGITTDWRTYWHDDRMAHMFDEPPGIDPTGDPTPARTETAYLGVYRNDVYGNVEVISGGAGLAVVLGPARRTCPMTHLDADSFTIVVYPELPDTRNAITFTIGTDSRADQLDLGNDAGPGTGLLSRVA
jgi:CubicO group peptidase (beta-lactamase class C family)